MFSDAISHDTGFRRSLVSLATSVRGLELGNSPAASISLSETDAIDIRTDYPFGILIRVTNYDRMKNEESSFGFVVRNSER